MRDYFLSVAWCSWSRFIFKDMPNIKKGLWKKAMESLSFFYRMLMEPRVLLLSK